MDVILAQVKPAKSRSSLPKHPEISKASKKALATVVAVWLALGLEVNAAPLEATNISAELVLYDLSGTGAVIDATLPSVSARWDDPLDASPEPLSQTRYTGEPDAATDGSTRPGPI